jgi:hypothetical protein
VRKPSEIAIALCRDIVKPSWPCTDIMPRTDIMKKLRKPLQSLPDVMTPCRDIMIMSGRPLRSLLAS